MPKLAHLAFLFAVIAASTSARADDGTCPADADVGFIEADLVGGENGGLDAVGYWEIEGLGGGGLVSATPINIPAPPSPDSGGEVSATPINIPAPPSPDSGDEVSATPINIPAPPSPDSGDEVSATPINIPAPPSPDGVVLVMTDEAGTPVGYVLGDRVDPEPIDDSLAAVWFGEYALYTPEGLVFGSFVLATDGAAASGTFLGACASR